MELHQRIEIPVSLTAVWRALNDPLVLKQCLAGCEQFEPIGDDTFSILLIAKVGPVKARFKGEVRLSEINEPYSYTISGTGNGGVAGFARGSATVNLEAKHADGELVTVMVYRVNAAVGGKLAQLGSRLVMGAARKMANDFFRQFVLLVSGNHVRRDQHGNVEIKIETIEDI